MASLFTTPTLPKNEFVGSDLDPLRRVYCRQLCAHQDPNVRAQSAIELNNACEIAGSTDKQLNKLVQAFLVGCTDTVSKVRENCAFALSECLIRNPSLLSVLLEVVESGSIDRAVPAHAESRFMDARPGLTRANLRQAAIFAVDQGLSKIRRQSDSVNEGIISFSEFKDLAARSVGDAVSVELRSPPMLSDPYQTPDRLPFLIGAVRFIRFYLAREDVLSKVWSKYQTDRTYVYTSLRGLIGDEEMAGLGISVKQMEISKMHLRPDLRALRVPRLT